MQTGPLRAKREGRELTAAGLWFRETEGGEGTVIQALFWVDDKTLTSALPTLARRCTQAFPGPSPLTYLPLLPSTSCVTLVPVI